MVYNMNNRKVQLLLLVTLLGTIMLGCVENVQPYDTNPRQLLQGETINIDGIDFTVENYELRDEFLGNHDLETFYNTEGHKFLYLHVNSENTGKESLEIPSQYDIIVLYQNRTYRSEINYHSEELEMYEYNWLEELLISPGQGKEGWILFQMPESVDVSKVNVIVEFPHTSYTQTAIWNLS